MTIPEKPQPTNTMWKERYEAAIKVIVSQTNLMSEMSRERNAFVAVLDPEGHNVVTAMVNARALRQRVEELEREARLNRQAAEKHYAYGEAQKEQAEAAEKRLEELERDLAARDVDCGCNARVVAAEAKLERVVELEAQARLREIDCANETARANDAEAKLTQAIDSMERAKREMALWQEKWAAAEAKLARATEERDQASREAESAEQRLVVVLGKIAATTTPHAAKLRDMARAALAAAKGE